MFTGLFQNVFVLNRACTERFFLRVILNIWTKEKGYKYIKRWTQVPNWLPQRTVKCFYEFNQDPRGFFKRESNARNNHVCTGVWHLLGHSSLCWRGRFFFTQEEVHFYPIKEEADRQRWRTLVHNFIVQSFVFCFNSLHTQRTPQKENRLPSKMDREVTL